MIGEDLRESAQQIEFEAQAEGSAAVTDLRELEAQFKLAADLFGRRETLGLSEEAADS